MHAFNAVCAHSVTHEHAELRGLCASPLHIAMVCDARPTVSCFRLLEWDAVQMGCFAHNP